MKIKHFNAIIFSVIIGIFTLSLISVSTNGLTRSNEKTKSINGDKNIDVKSILTQYDEWELLEPETFTWKYIFGSNKYAFFAHSIDYYKNIEPEMKNEIKSMIIIGSYYIRGNTIYLDNDSGEKETLIFKGKGNVKFSDASGHRYSKNGYYFHSALSESNKYMSSKKSTVENNDAVIDELAQLR